MTTTIIWRLPDLIRHVAECHGCARTATELSGGFDHAIDNYRKRSESDAVGAPAVLLPDRDIMFVQMLFRDNDPLKDRVAIKDGVMTCSGTPLKRSMQGVLGVTPPEIGHDQDVPPNFDGADR